MNHRFKALALLIALSFLPAMAQDYVVHVNGMVCEFCSLGVSKKVSRLPFIDRSRFDKGVQVDIENQMVTIAVKPDTKLDIDALFKAIESGGYKPVEIFEITPEGERKALQP